MEIKSRDPERWVDAMMVDELGMLPDERTPLRAGLATYSAFVLAGAIPLASLSGGVGCANSSTDGIFRFPGYVGRGSFYSGFR